MTSRTLSAVGLAAAATFACHTEAEEIAAPVETTDANVPLPSARAWLDEVRWTHRLLVVTGPRDERDAQLGRFAGEDENLLDRDLLLIEVSPDAVRVAVGTRADAPPSPDLASSLGLNVERFEVVLVGLDGGVKERDSRPIDPELVWSRIDAMPMRAAELRARDR